MDIILKAWIEQTKLFNVIREETSRGHMLPVIKTRNPSMLITLHPGVVIEKAEDLPEEYILEFYRNSPLYKGEEKTVDTEITNITKLLK